MQIILASSSRIRFQLLKQIGLPFTVVAPDLDETLLASDSGPEAYVKRLSLAKARKVALDHPSSLVIAADQCCVLGAEIMGKPGTPERALDQLKQCQGQWLRFYTSLTVAAPVQGFPLTVTEPFNVRFAQLAETDLKEYLKADQPWDCAGSFRLEGRGPLLFSDMDGRDYTALLGLPLLALGQLLRRAGINPLQCTGKPDSF